MTVPVPPHHRDPGDGTPSPSPFGAHTQPIATHDHQGHSQLDAPSSVHLGDHGTLDTFADAPTTDDGLDSYDSFAATSFDSTDYSSFQSAASSHHDVVDYSAVDETVLDASDNDTPVTGIVQSRAIFTAEETRRLLAEAVDIDVDAVTPRRTLLMADLYNYRTRSFTRARVLVDSGSEIVLASDDYYGDAHPCPAVSVAGIGSTHALRESGRALIVLGDGDARHAVAVKAHCIGRIGRGAVQLLLSAAVAAALGLISMPLHGAADPDSLLPELSAHADLDVLYRRATAAPPAPSASAVAAVASATTPCHPLPRSLTPPAPATPATASSSRPSTTATSTSVKTPTASVSTTATTSSTATSTSTRPASSGPSASRPGASTATATTSSTAKLLYSMPSHPTATVEAALADVLVGKSMARKDPFPSVSYTVDDVHWGCCESQEAIDRSGIPNVTPDGTLTLDQIRRVREVFLEYPDAWSKTKVPQPVRRAPVEVKLVDGARPIHLPAPSPGPWSHQYLWRMRQFYEPLGVLVEDHFSQWATYTHPTKKEGVDDDGVPLALRPASNLIPVNQRTEKFKYQLPDGREQLEKAAAPSHFKLHTDAMAAFTGFTLSDEASRVMTTWLPAGPHPSDGWTKMRSTRLLYGWCNSPAIVQQHYDEMKASMSLQTLENLANYIDDFMLSAPYLPDRNVAFEFFLDILRDFLAALVRFGVQLSYAKTRCGHKSFVFYGFKTENGATSLGARNLAAIRAIGPPTGPHDLLRTLGILNWSRDWCPQYSTLTASLTDLTKTGVKFDWQPEHQHALDELKRRLIDSVANYRVDNRYPLVIESDASAVGVGGRLFQVIDGVEKNIGYYSRKLTATERRLSVPLRECLGLVTALKRWRIYLLSNPHPTEARTDHYALVFMQSIHRGSLSCAQLVDVADVDLRIVYIPGRRNVIADALSRVAAASPRELTQPGILAALDKLLDNLDATYKTVETVWVWAGDDTPEVARRVQQWRTPRNAIRTGSSDNDKHLSAAWDLAILVPSPLRAATVAAQLIRQRRPAAILLPSDSSSTSPTRTTATPSYLSFVARPSSTSSSQTRPGSAPTFAPLRLCVSLARLRTTTTTATTSTWTDASSSSAPSTRCRFGRSRSTSRYAAPSPRATKLRSAIAYSPSSTPSPRSSHPTPTRPPTFHARPPPTAWAHRRQSVPSTQLCSSSATRTTGPSCSRQTTALPTAASSASPTA